MPSQAGAVPEHVLVDFVVPPLYVGPLSALAPPGFSIGPNSGYVWARFSITESPVGPGWDGEGVFEDGESEDYLLQIQAPQDMDIPTLSHWGMATLMLLLAFSALVAVILKQRPR